VDAPPHQGFADVLVLSQNVGGVVLTTSMGEIKREELRHFKKSLLGTRGTLLGCLVNNVDMSRRYGYQSYYKYYQYYSYGNDAGGAKKLPQETSA
jgi:Mrp family chromosome partitioning ATPase